MKDGAILNLAITKKFLNLSFLEKILFAAFTLIFIMICTYVVFITGGTNLSYLHLMYIPIIMSGLVFGEIGGVLTAIFAGLFLSIIPNDVENNWPQPMSSIIARTFFFSIIGGLSGYGSRLLRKYINDLEERFLRDPLTGLLNLGGLRKKFMEDIANSDGSYLMIGVEITNIEAIQLSIGHENTAQLLKNIASKLNQTKPEHGILAKVDLNTFIVVYEESDMIPTDFILSSKAVIANSINVGDIQMFIEYYYGITNFPKDAKSFSELLRKTKTATKLAKQNFVDYHVFDGEDESKSNNIVILNEIAESIKNGEINLHYQAQINMKTNKIESFEALARWESPTLGPVGPDVFVPLVESSRLIDDFSDLVLKKAISQLSVWRKEFPDDDLSMAINMSVKNFRNKNIIDNLKAYLREFEVPAANIEIELTESAIAADMNQVIENIEQIRSLGIRVAIDDFGTGSASIQYLFDLPVDTLKLDRSFILHMKNRQKKQKEKTKDPIINSVIEMSHNMGLNVIVEGIESESDYNTLKSMGCDFAQGYWIHRPTDSDSTTLLMKRNKKEGGQKKSNIEILSDYK